MKCSKNTCNADATAAEAVAALPLSAFRLSAAERKFIFLLPLIDNAVGDHDENLMYRHP